MSGTRHGIGWDSHRLIRPHPPRPLILGGVEVPEADFCLDGHSDADVLTHAVIDAILGAAGLDDIGTHFPDTDERYRGADSIVLLQAAMEAVRERGLRVTHVDTTVMMERPKVGPHRPAIRARLATVLGLDVPDVNVKATTGEGMGFVGRGEGVAAMAVATLERVA